MIRITTLLAAVLLAACSTDTLRPLEQQIDALTAPLDARVGVAVRTPDGDWITRQDTLLPMLSVFKFPLALAVLDRAAETGTPLSQPLDVGPEWLDAGTYSPMRDSLPAAGGSVTLSALLHYSTSLSDNIACDRLLAFVGGPAAVEAYVRELGIGGIRIVATERMMHRDPDAVRANAARPSAICKLYARFLEGELLNEEYNALLHGLLEKATTGANKLRAGVPATVILGHKTGSSDRTAEGIRTAENDSGYVLLPDGRHYCITVLVTDSREDDATNTAVIAGISKTVYEYFTRKETTR